jgi:hypothetical protein
MMIARSIIAIALAIAAGEALAQDTAPYCADLKRVASLASARDRFASLAGKPREGNFSDTVLPLTGWKDCSLYGSGMYTCDSPGLPTRNEAEKAQARATDEILSCFAGSWLEIKDRSSPGYVVLHPARGPASITLSIDEGDSKEFIVRMTLFVRGS